MTNDRLADIRRKTEAATRGPWRRSQYGVEAEHHDPKVDADIDLREAVIVDGVNDKAADLDFCAMARTAIPELLAALETARATIPLVKGILDELAGRSCMHEGGWECGTTPWEIENGWTGLEHKCLPCKARAALDALATRLEGLR